MLGFGLGEFKKENARGEVVDVGETVVGDCCGQLVGDDLWGGRQWGSVIRGGVSTCRSREEKRCFMVGVWRRRGGEC